jgi:hypothetical protein
MKNIERAKLKIKENSLAAEQKIIRREELKHKWAMRAARGRQNVLKAQALANRSGFVEVPYETNTFSLWEHRMGLRKELRSTHLARCFLRNTPYASAEPFSYTQPDWNRIQTLVERYSGEDKGVVTQRYAQWMQEGLRGVQPYQTDGHFGSDKRQPRSGIDEVWINAQKAA